jgi:hypothetical protein
MSDSMRWRYGDTNPVVMPVHSATVIEIGDLLYIDAGYAKPAGDQADQLTKDDNQIMFHTHFAGVAMQRSPAGDDSPIRVATTGVFEFGCSAATFEIGDLIGADELASGTQLGNQIVAKVSAIDHAIGRCVKRAATAITRTLVDIVSTAVKGGPATPA